MKNPILDLDFCIPTVQVLSDIEYILSKQNWIKSYTVSDIEEPGVVKIKLNYFFWQKLFYLKNVISNRQKLESYLLQRLPCYVDLIIK